MSQREVKFVGLGTTQKHCVVYVDIEVNGVKHPHRLLVPWWEFTRKEIQYEVNCAVARRLRAEWESDPPPWSRDETLPGID